MSIIFRKVGVQAGTLLFPLSAEGVLTRQNATPCYLLQDPLGEVKACVVDPEPDSVVRARERRERLSCS